MAVNYVCPKCKASLFNAETRKLTLKGVLKGKHFSAESIFELNHQQNEFGGTVLAKNLLIEKGARVDFSCPHCGQDFTPLFDEELSEIIIVDDNGTEQTFFFSKIAGREMSFIVCKEKKELIDSFGKDHAEYLYKIYDYFNMWNRF